MRALVWHCKEDIRCDTVTDPEIEGPRDAIVKVTSCAICGSDLHLFHNFIPAMMPGDIMGHEMMGEVVETGSGVNGKLKKGDRVGPNNPLGLMWIGLSKPSYGGTPDPSAVGKSRSHGCVRVTNWDADRLAGMLNKGVSVNFIEGQKPRDESGRKFTAC
jgi:NADPH:quinone reductase-like Zn-dependent oxidoreductase